MQTILEKSLELFNNSNEFIACVEYTASKTGFRTELIEKDFLCSIVLMYVYEALDTPLIFKGGTSLAKIHAGFYRLSEDLDFSIDIPHNASRKQRSVMVKPFKSIIDNIPKQVGIFSIDTPLSGTNESKQYNAKLSYNSHISPMPGQILFEIAVREEHLQQMSIEITNTILMDYIAEKPIVLPFNTCCFSIYETYAEKMRAALTRPKPAIRDFYDIHYAVKHKLIDLSDTSYTDLVKAKLSVSGTASVDLSQNKLLELKHQVPAELIPTLRENKEENFSLVTVFELLQEYVAKHIK